MKHYILVIVLLAIVLPASASDYDEFKIKREEVFEFVEKPKVTIKGDRVTITFETKGFCDCTIAVEDLEGKIIRHLASGVLGDNVPQPFQKNSKKQTIVWDGKDDTGKYIDIKDNVAIRVSLGIKPQFERTLYWNPKKRIGAGNGLGANTQTTLPVPLICPTPEGVYVFEGHGVDHLKLFDHKGNYVRTVYPFPRDQVSNVKGLTRAVFPQDNLNLPRKIGYVQATLLTSGATSSNGKGASMWGSGATSLSVYNGRIALVQRRLNRIAADGSSGGLALTGGKTSWPVAISNRYRKKKREVSPTSIAVSPDGKWVYLAGYQWRTGREGVDLIKGCLHGVARIPYNGKGDAELFAGSLEFGKMGSGQGQFKDATSVACDTKGRVYVADFMNDRIQVFMPDGTFFKSFKTKKPARLSVNQKTGEIYVYSWAMQNDHTLGALSQNNKIKIEAKLTLYGTIDKPGKGKTVPLPFAGYRGTYKFNDKWGGLQYNTILDPWSDPPVLWVVSGNKKASYISGGGNYVRTRSDWDEWNIKLYALKNGKLEMIRDFGKEVAQSVKRAKPPMYWRQRLYVNHKTGKLFVGEQVTDLGKSFSEILEIDPDTGGIRKVKLPFDAEDLAFDMEGHIYLRSRYELVRYNPVTWREVPFDYGEERTQIAYNSSSRARADVISAIPLYTGTLWHKGGLWVNPKGHIVISCYATKDLMPHYEKRTDAKMIGGGSPPGKNEKHVKGNVFVPRFFPGRNYYGEIHIYDKHGVSIHKDQVPGIAIIDGLFIDQDDSVYCMAGSTRVLDGKKYFSDFTGTLMKFKLNKGRVITAGKGRQPVVLPKGDEPKRPHDIIGTVQGHAWVKDAEWFYGGVGYAGRAAGSHRMGGATCACYNTRFTMDYFNRSFAPEFDRYSVAVLDSNGNLILRIGKYGNVDNGIPLIPESGIRNPVSVGGDEVALFYACYVAAHTDKRLFIADAGNARILSVKLGYHSEEKVALKDVK